MPSRSLPTASVLLIINAALTPPKRLGLPGSASPMLPGTLLPARARAPQLHRGFTPSSILIFNQRWLSGFGAATGTLLPLPGVSALCLALAERAGMTFPKGLNKPLGYREIEGRGGVTAPSLPQSHSAPRLQAPGVRAATTQCLPNPALLGWIFKIGL